MAKFEVSASATGIGIREDGPTQAQVGATISYTITVTNLGDYWDRNITLTDKFPNGTSSSWNVPDLAPLLQTGHEFEISQIQYTIGPGDVLPQNPPNVVNNVQVTGYADVNGLPELVQAETNYPTIILTPPVAIFTESDHYPVVNETVTFNASSSYAPDGQIVKYEWDWIGNGTYVDAGTNPIATHAYAQPGVYYPTLRVTDNDGLTNTTTQRKLVSPLVVGGYSVPLETAYPQTPNIIYVIMILGVTAASEYTHFQLKHIRISLNGLGHQNSQPQADRRKVHSTIERFRQKKTHSG
jgi:uncharacterized repeat protein (TIGR01451 family)